MTNAIIWTKNRNLDCLKAVNLAIRMGLTVEQRNIDGNQWKLSDFQAAVPGATTLPQIVIGDVVLGGLKELLAKSKEQQAAAPQVSLKTKAERVAAANSKANAKRQAYSVAKSDKKQAAIQAAMEGTTREQRHAAKDEAIQKTQARIAAKTPAPRMTPQGYIIGAPADAPLEHHQARFQEAQAVRVARAETANTANAARVAARVAAKKQRVTAAIEARRQRVGV
jgi:hypothetical protein